MRTTALWLCLPWLVAALGEPKSYVLEDGKVIRAEVLSVKGDRVEMRIHQAAGTMTSTMSLAEFAPQSAFNIKRSVTEPDDLEGHLALAEFAAQHNLIATARRELRHCREIAQHQKLDPEFEKHLVRRALTIMRTVLHNLTTAGKSKDARYVLSQIMLLDSDRLSDEDKAGLVDLVQTSLDDKSAAEASASRADDDDATRARRQKLLEPLHTGMDRGRAARRKGMLNSKQPSAALSAFDRAIREFEGVERRAESLVRKNPDDEALDQDLDSLTKEARGYVASTLLDQASVHLMRGQINEAMGRVNRVLAVEPKNRQALAMRGRIEIAANEAGRVIGRR